MGGWDRGSSATLPKFSVDVPLFPINLFNEEVTINVHKNQCSTKVSKLK